MKFTISLLPALIATTRAIYITSPPPPDPVDVSKNWTVTWTHVDTDPISFCLYLTNYKEYPPQEFFLSSASRDPDTVVIQGRCYPGLRERSTYRVWASKCGDPLTIYAESRDFHVIQPGCPA
ncbi:hypothetical protein P170DRAFT_510513 [Aspergillus steynii IBT 23096]|uniref:Fibronectin type-III domain-containing protein n=1 Tax=Aspergillus steynii IBT 23096 TaxID=1392250 RepID=A0A2I2G4E8_9EURO|nr:uncharacterized protein P170DRAFT_510513 [Aspergillus steynii IBT 23096]PLB47755.1 hypothetical protein P170DRAFT_510513 [Aspergillus steynii IBT 23096]